MNAATTWIKGWAAAALAGAGGARLCRDRVNRRRPHAVRVLSAHRVIDERRAETEADRRDLARGCLRLSAFAARLRYLKRNYRFVALPEYAEQLTRGAAPAPNALVLTFDDGYRDVLANACPVLVAEAVPFTVALTTGWVGSGPLWLSASEVRDLAVRARGWVSWAAHGVTHRPLTELGAEEAEREIVESRRQTEALTGAPVSLFCYPDGKFDDRIRALLVKHGFAAACATGRDLNSGAVDRFALKRIPFEQEPMGRFAFRVAGRT